MVHLEEVTPENWRIPLQVKEEQKRYVADTRNILARAYAFRACGSQAKLIYADETAVGMLLYHEWEDGNTYIFSELLIDERYQRKGYGQAAAELVLEQMRNDGKYEKVILCYIEGNDAARTFYEKLGFTHTGEADEDEIIMCKNLH